MAGKITEHSSGQTRQFNFHLFHGTGRVGDYSDVTTTNPNDPKLVTVVERKGFALDFKDLEVGGVSYVGLRGQIEVSGQGTHWEAHIAGQAVGQVVELDPHKLFVAGATGRLDQIGLTLLSGQITVGHSKTVEIGPGQTREGVRTLFNGVVSVGHFDATFADGSTHFSGSAKSYSGNLPGGVSFVFAG